MVAFYLKSIKGNATFWAAIITEILVICIYLADVISFLWLNVIGCLLVMGIAYVFSFFESDGTNKPEANDLIKDEPRHLV